MDKHPSRVTQLVRCMAETQIQSLGSRITESQGPAAGHGPEPVVSSREDQGEGGRPLHCSSRLRPGSEHPVLPEAREAREQGLECTSQSSRPRRKHRLLEWEQRLSPVPEVTSDG